MKIYYQFNNEYSSGDLDYFGETSLVSIMQAIVDKVTWVNRSDTFIVRDRAVREAKDGIDFVYFMDKDEVVVLYDRIGKPITNDAIERMWSVIREGTTR